MDKIEKFLRDRAEKERKYLREVIFPKILNLDLKGLDVKKLRGYPLWRVRYKKIRIVFAKAANKGIVFRLDFRGKIYKNLDQ